MICMFSFGYDCPASKDSRQQQLRKFVSLLWATSKTETLLSAGSSSHFMGEDLQSLKYERASDLEQQLNSEAHKI
ncbi:hypothetical protein RchiOBHm_Chr2g0174501 [Rosa chinensis]|uniref:Uncharacterized protein n=1 Tax=Rosa chinensis TaxID=74649 RepID=A0A2P6S667_ROSCH|nr:hypothetical protein RchiOBHm_Chr2g0174501 [Rosa chinensis]